MGLSDSSIAEIFPQGSGFNLANENLNLYPLSWRFSKGKHPLEEGFHEQFDLAFSLALVQVNCL